MRSRSTAKGVGVLFLVCLREVKRWNHELRAPMESARGTPRMGTEGGEGRKKGVHKSTRTGDLVPVSPWTTSLDYLKLKWSHML